MKAFGKLFNHCPFAGKTLLTLFAVAFLSQPLIAQQIDIGIFRTANDEVEIRIRPDFDIFADHEFSEIRYTLRWPSNLSVSITDVEQIAPFNIVQDPGTNVIDMGFEYQTFRHSTVSFPIREFGEDYNAGDEILLSVIKHTGGGNFIFELVPTDDMQFPNTDYYFEYFCSGTATDGLCDTETGEVDVTGILYAMVTLPLANWTIFATIFLILITSVFLLRKKF